MKHLLILSLACALAVPADAGELPPWASAADFRELAPGEKSLWQEADEFDRALAHAGKVNPDPALNAYLQGIMDRLYPEFGGRLRVRPLNAQQINAFALPNGSIYVNSGLIARFENEAQLATVLAHEGRTSPIATRCSRPKTSRVRRRLPWWSACWECRWWATSSPCRRCSAIRASMSAKPTKSATGA